MSSFLRTVRTRHPRLGYRPSLVDHVASVTHNYNYSPPSGRTYYFSWFLEDDGVTLEPHEVNSLKMLLENLQSIQARGWDLTNRQQRLLDVGIARGYTVGRPAIRPRSMYADALGGTLGLTHQQRRKLWKEHAEEVEWNTELKIEAEQSVPDDKPVTENHNKIQRRVPTAEQRVPTAEQRVPTAEQKVPTAEQKVPAADRCRLVDFIPWVKYRPYELFDSSSHPPDLSERQDIAYHSLDKGASSFRQVPSRVHHDVFESAYRVALVEKAIDYRFRNKLLCVEALKGTGPEILLYWEGATMRVPNRHRLALIGDRALCWVIAELWWRTGNETRDYARIQSETSTRQTLAIRGLKMGFDKAVLRSVNDETRPPTTNEIAETFEAILGAVYVDSGNELDGVARIIQIAGLDQHELLRIAGENKQETELARAVEETRNTVTDTTKDEKAERVEQVIDERAPRPWYTAWKRLAKLSPQGVSMTPRTAEKPLGEENPMGGQPHLAEKLEKPADELTRTVPEHVIAKNDVSGNSEAVKRAAVVEETKRGIKEAGEPEKTTATEMASKYDKYKRRQNDLKPSITDYELTQQKIKLWSLIHAKAEKEGSKRNAEFRLRYFKQRLSVFESQLKRAAFSQEIQPGQTHLGDHCTEMEDILNRIDCLRALKSHVEYKLRYKPSMNHVRQSRLREEASRLQTKILRLQLNLKRLSPQTVEDLELNKNEGVVGEGEQGEEQRMGGESALSLGDEMGVETSEVIEVAHEVDVEAEVSLDENIPVVETAEIVEVPNMADSEAAAMPADEYLPIVGKVDIIGESSVAKPACVTSPAAGEETDPCRAGPIISDDVSPKMRPNSSSTQAVDP